jgi:hypothetical protein
MQRAALNYNEKLEAEYESFKERNRYLDELRGKVKK